MTDEMEKAPEGTPTRGEGLPQDRSGGAVPSRFEKKREEKERELKAKQQAAQEKAKRDWEKSRVTKGEINQLTDGIFSAITAINTQSAGIGKRMESLIWGVRTWANENFPETKLDEYLNDAHERMMKWNATVQAIETMTFPLSQILDTIFKWNSDPKNPKIASQSFRPGSMEEKIQKDLDLDKEAKVSLMTELGYSEEKKAEILKKIEEALLPQGFQDWEPAQE